MLVHCEAVIATFDAFVTRPYWSTVTLDTFAPDPYRPAATPLTGRLPVDIVPTRFEEFRFEIAEPLEAMSNPWTERPVRVPTDVMLVWAGCTTELAVATVSMMALE